MGFKRFIMKIHPFICISIILISSIAQSDTSFVGRLFGVSKCSYKCPNGNAPVRNLTANTRYNGCGSYGLIMDVSSYPGFLDCCIAHDRCYSTCNSGQNTCDHSFKSCLKVKCNWNAKDGVHDEAMTDTCFALAETMHLVVELFGCNAYQGGQEFSCIC